MKPSLLFVCSTVYVNRRVLRTGRASSPPHFGDETRSAEIGRFMATVEAHGRAPRQDISPAHGCSNDSHNMASARVPPGAVFAHSRPNNTGRRKAPQWGLKAPLWSSSEDLSDRNRPNVGGSHSLSPVRGPCAATAAFSSVASAFDFQHHLGTDPARELLVLKRILHRECLLSRLEAVCAELRKTCRRPLTVGGLSVGTVVLLGDSTEDVVNMLSSMRDATVAVVEAIAVWREGMVDRHPPPAFVWHGENYLLKVTDDLNFLAGVEPLVGALKVTL